MSYSKTIYFIPVWFDDFDFFTAALSDSNLWNDAAAEKYTPRYLLNYATRIAQNSSLFRLFELKDLSSLNIYMFCEELQLENIPSIDQVRFSCFSTGVGFLEFWVSYEDMTPENIADFAYLFKKAAKMCGKKTANGKHALYDAAVSLMPESAEAQLFFSATVPFKYECICFHFIHLDEQPGSDESVRDRLCRLSRSYNTKFTSSFESDYDMIYRSGAGDCWGGSSEGLVNITYDFESSDSDYYLHNIKLSHLSVDYYFLYLLLLNQRFTAIQYINDIAKNFHKNPSDAEDLNKRIVELKAVFSFNVLSDDKIFQNVYSKMYSILEIEQLLADIVDNESQMQILQSANSAKVEKLSSKFLFGISLLSLFSALIDASSYFDRIRGLQSVSTILGFLCVCATVALCLFWLVREQK